jgi:hypothetical protein
LDSRNILISLNSLRLSIREISYCNDKKTLKTARVEAEQVLGGSAWSRYLVPEEEFAREDFYGGGQLHKPPLKYFLDLFKVIPEDEKNDPRGL